MIVQRGPWRGWQQADGPSSVTIGVLDGVHLGHRALISHLDAEMTTTVLTFDPHPVEVLRPGTRPRLITDIDERARLLGEAGISRVGVLDLAEIRYQSPEEFVSMVLVDKLRVGQLVVGKDFRFGKDRSGDIELLARMAGEGDFTLDVIELVADDGEPVSSSRIRALIEAGDVVAAARLLGSWFQLTNTVVDGDKRGREIGFPTANILPPPRKVLPAHGIYSCFAVIEGRSHDAAVNVGVRPTFGGGEVVVEAHILDFNDDLYGKQMTLEFVDYTRPELAFSNIDDLVERMNDDVVRARWVLERARTGI